MMIRSRRSSITCPRPSPYYVVQKDAALGIISNHKKYLLGVKDLIDSTLIRSMERGFEGTYLDRVARKLVRSKHRVNNQITFLEKVEDELSSSTESEIHSPLSILSQHLQDLHQKLALVSKAEEYLRSGISLGQKQLNHICLKSGVVHEIDVLDKVYKDISLGQLHVTQSHQGRQVVEYELPPLLMRFCEFRGFADYVSGYGEFYKAVRNLVYPCKLVQ